MLWDWPRRLEEESLCVKLGSKAEPFLFATEPKQNCSDVKMYYIYRITESFGTKKTMVIINTADVCTDITTVKKAAVDDAM